MIFIKLASIAYYDYNYYMKLVFQPINDDNQKLHNRLLIDTVLSLRDKNLVLMQDLCCYASIERVCSLNAWCSVGVRLR